MGGAQCRGDAEGEEGGWLGATCGSAESASQPRPELPSSSREPHGPAGATSPSGTGSPRLGVSDLPTGRQPQGEDGTPARSLLPHTEGEEMRVLR